MKIKYLIAGVLSFFSSSFAIDWPKSNFNPSDISLIKAEEFFKWKLYEEAIPLYSEVIQNLSTTKHPQKHLYQLRLAEAYFLNEHYVQALDLLKEVDGNHMFSEWEIFLKSLIYRKLKNYTQAETVITSALDKKKDFLLLQLAIIYFEKKEYQKASLMFDRLKSYSFNPNIQLMTDIYRVKIAHIQENYEAASQILATISYTQNSSQFLEILFLKGCNAFFLKKPIKAIDYFIQMIEQRQHDYENWLPSVVFSTIQAAIEFYHHKPNQQNIDQLAQTEVQLETLQRQFPSHENFLALAELLLLKSNIFKSLEEKQKCILFLENQPQPQDENFKLQLLILRAQLAESYCAREDLLQKVTLEENYLSSSFSIGWLLRAINNKNEAHSLQNDKKSLFFSQALACYKKAILTADSFSPYRKQAIESFVQTCIEFNELQDLEDAHCFLTSLGEKEQDPETLNEFLFQSAQLACSIYIHNGNIQRLQQATSDLNRALVSIDCKKNDRIFFLLGKIYSFTENHIEAKNAFSKLMTQYPHSIFLGEALFWYANCMETEEEKQKIYRSIFLEHPESSFAAEAYFRLYNQDLYLQGDKKAIKHLLKFIKKYPNQPLTMNALFLLGLNAKRTKQNKEGQWHSKNLVQAIDFFQNLEILYEHLQEESLLPKETATHYRELYYRAILERGNANFLIGQDARDAKRQIYLKYAEEVFKSLSTKILEKNIDQSELLFESLLKLAITCIESKNESLAKETLEEIISKCRQAGVTQGYYLSRAFYYLGEIEFDHKNYSNALLNFNHAEETAKGRILNTSQRLSQWIKISACLKHLKKYDLAMSQLSKVINANAVSSLRIKAMCLRAEIYTLQGRDELARKQLEAAATKGGEWGQKAQEQLVKDYGYR